VKTIRISPVLERNAYRTRGTLPVEPQLDGQPVIRPDAEEGISAGVVLHGNAKAILSACFLSAEQLEIGKARLQVDDHQVKLLGADEIANPGGQQLIFFPCIPAPGAFRSAPDLRDGTRRRLPEINGIGPDRR